MIKTDRQLAVTKATVQKFQADLSSFDREAAAASGLAPQLVEAHQASLKSTLEEMRSKIAEYEALKASTNPIVEDIELEHLPLFLIKARIARRWTQRDLAEKLGLKEQQIQRYEADEYAGASLARLIKVANALNLEVSIRATSRSAEAPKPQLAKVITKKARPAASTTAKRSAKKAPAQSRTKPTRSRAKTPRSRVRPEAKRG